MGNSFQFKQFTIEQSLCAMKVGTDGVLIGAWTSVPNGNVLDVGCGSGLISLMLAQRNQKCKIDAIDIEEGAFNQTKINIENSPFKTQIVTYWSSFQNFQPDKKYELIISNPPFFVNSYQSEKSTKMIARHTDELPFEDFIFKTVELLQPNGILSIVLPTIQAELFINLSKKNELYLNRICSVQPNFEKAPKRVLMEFSLNQSTPQKEQLTIETNQRHHYTKEYRNLTKDFYLKF